jgi:putative hemolysin
MSADTLLTIGLLLATALLIAGNALFVFHEFAFVMLKQPQIRKLERSDSSIGRLIAKTANKLDHYIAVDQLGITITSLAVGWIGQPLLARLLVGPFEAIGAFPGAVPAISFVVAFMFITGVQMVAGELIPKSVALRNPQGVARAVVLPVELVARIFHPLVWLLNGMGILTVRALGFNAQGEGHNQALPVEELLVLIQASARAGAINADPMLLRRALHFSDIEAQDLIVPRQDITALELHMTIEDLLAVARQSGFTRFPVYDGTIDTIIGVLNVKDLVQLDQSGEVAYVSNWRRWIRPIPALPEHATIEQVLTRLAQDKQPMMLLLDEFGGTAGILTVADIADELTGDADDIQPAGDRLYLIKGETAVSTVEATLDIELGMDEDNRNYESMGGLVMEALGRIPATGDEVSVDGAEIRVTSMRGRRVTEVSLTLPEKPSLVDIEA